MNQKNQTKQESNKVAKQSNSNVKVVEVNGKKGKIEIVKTKRSGIVAIQQND